VQCENIREVKLARNSSIEKLAILVADVGGSKNFGWAGEWGSTTKSGRSIDELAEALLDLVKDSWRVSLGFECPLFIPCPADAAALVKQRDGEAGKPWCAGAGANAGILGIQQLCWPLGTLKSNVQREVRATLDWDDFKTGSYSLYLWEAFVTGKAKSDSHIGDAQKALRTFANAMPDLEAANSVKCSRPISLAGLALLWSGLSLDVSVLHRPTLVLRT
jgi:hypothetical protein